MLSKKASCKFKYEILFTCIKWAHSNVRKAHHFGKIHINFTIADASGEEKGRHGKGRHAEGINC